LMYLLDISEEEERILIKPQDLNLSMRFNGG
jgi:hypothetical protein